MLSDELPPLPAKTLLRRVMPDDFRYGDVIGYTADQMREYARAVERAAYEHAARVCEANENRIVKTHPVRIEIDPDSMMARKCAAAIRALGRQR